MKQIKQSYLSPVTETLVVRFEGNLLRVSNPGDNEGYKKDSSPYNGGWDDDDD